MPALGHLQACCRHTAGILPYLPHNMLHDVPVPYRGLYNFKKDRRQPEN